MSDYFRVENVVKHFTVTVDEDVLMKTHDMLIENLLSKAGRFKTYNSFYEKYMEEIHVATRWGDVLKRRTVALLVEAIEG